MRVRLKGIHTVRSSGRVYRYAWRGGPRLDGQPGTPEFSASYDRAVRSRHVSGDGTLLSLVAAFKVSSEFTTLAPRTREDYLKKIVLIEDEFADFPLSALGDRRTRGIFKDWRDRLAARSLRQADYAWTVLARILAVAKDRGMTDVNPCERGGRLYAADRNDHVWRAEDETAFLASAPKHLHLAIQLALWTGQRQGDLLRLTWSNYDGNRIRLRQGKTRRRVTIPVGEPLRLALDAAMVDRRSPVILLTEEGAPWTGAGFRSSWGKAVAKAGINDLTFHDLRGSAVTRLALAGATELEIAAITGLSVRDVSAILDAHYLSRDVGLAENAVRKLEKRTKAVKTAVKTRLASGGSGGNSSTE